jgi:hypothetical protein
MGLACLASLLAAAVQGKNDILEEHKFNPPECITQINRSLISVSVEYDALRNSPDIGTQLSRAWPP